MMYLKILLPILIFVVAIIQNILKYKWHDKRTKIHKATLNCLYAFLALFLIVNILVVYLDHDRNVEAQKKASSERAELKAMLDPFISYAKQEFPDEKTQEALDKVAKDLQNLRKEALPHKYRPLQQEYANEMLKRLQLFLKKYSNKELKIIIGFDINKEGHREVENFLKSTFGKVGIHLEIGSPYSNIPNDPKPIFAWFPVEKKQCINDLLFAISPMFDINSEDSISSLQYSGDKPSALKKIVINFRMSFKFREDGKVYFN